MCRKAGGVARNALRDVWVLEMDRFEPTVSVMHLFQSPAVGHEGAICSEMKLMEP